MNTWGGISLTLILFVLATSSVCAQNDEDLFRSLNPPLTWETIPPPAPTPPPRGFSLQSATQHRVKLLYIIPYDRTERTGVRQAMKDVVLTAREFFESQMVLHGFGPRTFQFEDDPAVPGTPLVHVLQETNPTYTAAWFRGGDAFAMYTTLRQRAAAAGFGTYPSHQEGVVWLIAGDIHQFNASGVIDGRTQAGQGSTNGGSGGGVGVTQTFAMAFAVDNFDTFADLRNIGSGSVNLGDKLTPYVPGPGPYNFVPEVTAFWYEGSTISEIGSTMIGSMIHEMSHGFNLFHDNKLDANFHGNLMGNGFRGIRGWLLPESFATQYTRLSYSSALQLSVSRFFSPDGSYSDNTVPSVSGVSSGAVAQNAQGLLPIQFTAQDTGSGLAVAVVRGIGVHGDTNSVLAELPLSGTSGTWTFHVYDYTPGVATTYRINVFDAAGNCSLTNTSITPSAPSNNIPPYPNFMASRYRVHPNESLWLDASTTFDKVYTGGNYTPNYGTSINFNWDLDGDGIFETNGGTARQLQVSFPSPGVRRVRMSAQDSSGAIAISPPLPIEVMDRVSSLLIHANFSWAGVESGSEWFPFNTLAEALAAVDAGGTIRMEPGSTEETLTIDQPVRLETSGGPVRIGAVF